MIRIIETDFVVVIPLRKDFNDSRLWEMEWLDYVQDRLKGLK